MAPFLNSLVLIKYICIGGEDGRRRKKIYDEG